MTRYEIELVRQLLDAHRLLREPAAKSIIEQRVESLLAIYDDNGGEESVMTKKPTVEIPLDEAEIRELATLLRDAITDTMSNRKAGIYRRILEKLYQGAHSS